MTTQLKKTEVGSYFIANYPPFSQWSAEGALADVCGLPPRDVMLVKAGTLPKTSSGKLQRARCRELYLGEALELA